ncbi:MAG: DUF2184 domain-containing protein [Elusimicrobia bacterium]|nr:DUF2184 domain-containing protein [Elusimicrobiota bacterium]
MNAQEARALFEQHRPMLESKGISWHTDEARPIAYLPEGMSWQMAMDALPTLASNPNAGIPAMLTTYIDPKVFRAVFAALAIADIAGAERKIGDWAEQTYIAPWVEPTGETTAYGDYNDGVTPSDINSTWPNWQQFLFQGTIDYGDLEIERMARGRINAVTEKQESRARNLNTFMNTAYAFGVAGLQNYGLTNDPLLSASLTPATKAYGGTAWQVGNVTRATPNEIFTDIQTLITLVVSQTQGRANMNSKMTLAVGPVSHMAITQTNSFGVNVSDLLKKNFPNLELNGMAPQYSALSSINPQGIAAGNLMQVIVHEIEGQETCFAGFGEKLRTFPVIRGMSSYRQKAVSGTWGTIIRFPAGIGSMVGI